MFKRVIWIILDSVGIGELPDADLFGDVGADTLGHIFETIKDYIAVIVLFSLSALRTITAI